MSNIVADSSTEKMTRRCQPWCADHQYDRELDVDWCQSQTVEVEGHRAFVSDAPADDGDRLHRTVIESNAAGLGIADLIKFTKETEELARLCFAASTAAIKAGGVF